MRRNTALSRPLQPLFDLAHTGIQQTKAVPRLLVLRSARSDSLDSLQDSERGQQLKPIFLTFHEAQLFLRVSHQTMYNLMKQGLPSHKIGRKSVFLREELVQWIKDH